MYTSVMLCRLQRCISPAYPHTCSCLGRSCSQAPAACCPHTPLHTLPLQHPSCTCPAHASSHAPFGLGMCLLHSKSRSTQHTGKAWTSDRHCSGAMCSKSSDNGSCACSQSIPACRGCAAVRLGALQPEQSSCQLLCSSSSTLLGLLPRSTGGHMALPAAAQQPLHATVANHESLLQVPHTWFGRLWLLLILWYWRWRV